MFYTLLLKSINDTQRKKIPFFFECHKNFIVIKKKKMKRSGLDEARGLEDVSFWAMRVRRRPLD